MGKTYIKKENGEKVLYEEGSLLDTRLGKLHEKLDGSLETRNAFGENYHLEKESSLFGTPDYTVKSSEGKSGTLKSENSFVHKGDRYEGELETRNTLSEDYHSEEERNSLREHSDYTAESSEDDSEDESGTLGDDWYKPGTLEAVRDAFVRRYNEDKFEDKFKSRKSGLEDSLNKSNEKKKWTPKEEPFKKGCFWGLASTFYIYPVLFGSILGGVNVFLKNKFDIDIPRDVVDTPRDAVGIGMEIGILIGVVYGIATWMKPYKKK